MLRRGLTSASNSNAPKINGNVHFPHFPNFRSILSQFFAAKISGCCACRCFRFFHGVEIRSKIHIEKIDVFTEEVLAANKLPKYPLKFPPKFLIFFRRNFHQIFRRNCHQIFHQNFSRIFHRIVCRIHAEFVSFFPTF